MIYDATYYTSPSAAWSQLPCDSYDFGSAWDLARFESGVAGMLALGVSSFMYDIQAETPAARAIVAQWAAWFKLHRAVLATGDVIHVARPNGQDVDVVVRARVGEPVPGLIILTNPSAADATLGALVVPLYYTGAAGGSSVLVGWGGAPGTPVALDWRARAVFTNVTVPARGLAWATVELVGEE